jgi:hypothetical protein
VIVLCLKVQKHLEIDSHVVWYTDCSWCAVDDADKIMVIVLRDLLKMGCSFDTFWLYDRERKGGGMNALQVFMQILYIHNNKLID